MRLVAYIDDILSPGRVQRTSKECCSVPLSMPWFLDEPDEPDGVVFIPASLEKQSRQGKPVTFFHHFRMIKKGYVLSQHLRRMRRVQHL